MRRAVIVVIHLTLISSLSLITSCKNLSNRGGSSQGTTSRGNQKNNDPLFPGASDNTSKERNPERTTARNIRETILAGRVVNLDGRSLGDVFIQCIPDGEKSEKPIGVQSDSDGNFVIQGLQPGVSYILSGRKEIDKSVLGGISIQRAPNTRILLRLSEQGVTDLTPKSMPPQGSLGPFNPPNRKIPSPSNSSIPGKSKQNLVPTGVPEPEDSSTAQPSVNSGNSSTNAPKNLSNTPTSEWSPNAGGGGSRDPIKNPSENTPKKNQNPNIANDDSSFGVLNQPKVIIPPQTIPSNNESTPRSLPPPVKKSKPNSNSNNPPINSIPSPSINSNSPFNSDLSKSLPGSVSLNPNSLNPNSLNQPDRSRVPTPKVNFRVLGLRENSDWEFRYASGKIILVEFWGTQCIPCIKSMPKLNHLAEVYVGPGLEIVGINTDSFASYAEAKNAVSNVAQQQSLRYSVYLDPRGSVQKQFRVQQIPTLILFRKDGTILWKHVGGDNTAFRQLEAIIKKELGK